MLLLHPLVLAHLHLGYILAHNHSLLSHLFGHLSIHQSRVLLIGGENFLRLLGCNKTWSFIDDYSLVNCLLLNYLGHLSLFGSLLSHLGLV